MLKWRTDSSLVHKAMIWLVCIVAIARVAGENDKATQEWKDGVLAVAFRSLSSDPSPDRKWVVLDGPVDAIWIENMNTGKQCLPLCPCCDVD